jgi:hypothetical protein
VISTQIPDAFDFLIVEEWSSSRRSFTAARRSNCWVQAMCWHRR